MKDQRGVVYVETLVAFLPVFAFFLAALQLADISVAHLIVRHASAAAARAAVVVLPDDGAYYGDRDNAHIHTFRGGRRQDVERAADLILRANPRLALDGANVRLDKASYTFRDDLRATVEARYRCLIPLFCAGGIDLSAASKLVYQGASFVYEFNGALIDNAIDRASRDIERSFSDRRDRGQNEAAGEPPRAGADSPRRREGEPAATSPAPSGRERGRRAPAAAPVAAGPRPRSADRADPQAGRPAPVAVLPPTRSRPSARPGDRTDRALPERPTPEEIEDALREAAGCFVEGTGISTPHGPRAIETLTAGETVFAYDEGEEKVVASTILRTFVRRASALVDLTVRFVGADRDEVISGTADHPFYLPRHGDYVAMAKLSRGAELLALDGRRVHVLSIALRHGDFRVFNFAVQGHNNYFVLGSNDPPSAVLVHNQTDECREAPSDPPSDQRASRDRLDAEQMEGEATGGAAATAASVVDKLDRYLLNPAHDVGRTKAKWFRKALGFTQENAAGLAKQIVFDRNKAVQTAVTPHGTKFNQVITITGANGRVIDVTFAWIHNNDGVVRLVTGIPPKP